LMTLSTKSRTLERISSCSGASVKSIMAVSPLQHVAFSHSAAP